MEAATGSARFGKMMERARHLLIGFCTGVVLVPLAAQADGPGHDMPAAQLAQAVLQLSEPRAVQVGGLAVGDTLDAKRLHVITRPGLYGLTGTSSGNAYGIIDGLLVRFDSSSLRLKSIIRAGVKPVD